MKFGKYQLDVVSDGKFRLDGGAMFGVVPKVIWNGLTPADEFNRILLATDCLLIRSDKRVILCESGIGDRWTKKEMNIYDIQREGRGIISGLDKLGISPDTVTDVIPSHLHFDHAGFLTMKEDSGKLKAVFPNARHHIQKKHLEWALNSSKKDRASFRSDDFMPLKELELIDFHEGKYTLFDDFEFFTSNGHTPFQQHLKLKSEGKYIVFCGDLIPTAKHVKLAYNMGYDNYPVENICEKEKLLSEIADTGSMLYFYHDPEIKLVTVRKNHKGYEVDRCLPFK